MMTSPWTDDNVLFERAQFFRCRLEELAARQTQASGYFSRKKRARAHVQVLAEVEVVEAQLASIDLEARVKDEFEEYCRGNSILRTLVKDKDDQIGQLRRPLERERHIDPLPDPNTRPHETMHCPILETQGIAAMQSLDPHPFGADAPPLRMRAYRKARMRQGNATWFECDAFRNEAWVNGRPVTDCALAAMNRRH